MEIALEGVERADVIALLQTHHQDMLRYSPPDSVHALQLDGLRQPHISFWTVRDNGQLLGCGALKALANGQGEIKSMRTDDHYRRRGVAAMLFTQIEQQARDRGSSRLNLETGSMAAFAPARALYHRFGFVDCQPFGDYQPDP